MQRRDESVTESSLSHCKSSSFEGPSSFGLDQCPVSQTDTETCCLSETLAGSLRSSFFFSFILPARPDHRPPRSKPVAHPGCSPSLSHSQGKGQEAGSPDRARVRFLGTTISLLAFPNERTVLRRVLLFPVPCVMVWRYDGGDDTDDDDHTKAEVRSQDGRSRSLASDHQRTERTQPTPQPRCRCGSNCEGSYTTASHSCHLIRHCQLTNLKFQGNINQSDPHQIEQNATNKRVKNKGSA